MELDTSGRVECAAAFQPLGWAIWSDLSPFVQGYVEALFASYAESIGYQPKFGAYPGRFSDLAPETLAAILKDCGRFVSVKTVSGKALLRQSYSWGELHHPAGVSFWRARNRLDGFNVEPIDRWEEPYSSELYTAACNFPPLTPYLADGKVRLRAAGK